MHNAKTPTLEPHSAQNPTPELHSVKTPTHTDTQELKLTSQPSCLAVKDSGFKTALNPLNHALSSLAHHSTQNQHQARARSC